MENSLAIVIVVDGLRASALGTYGNTSFPTPYFNELASRSLVVEWLLAESLHPRDFYRAACRSIPKDGVRRWLITDVAEVAQFARDLFDETICLKPGFAEAATKVQDTHTANFFAEAVEQLSLWRKDVSEHNSQGLLWIHFSGLCGPWDAPLDLREALMDEEDPEAASFVTPPASISNVHDPDELLRYRVAYAAQVTVIVLDSCLSGFLEAYKSIARDKQWLVMVLGLRGFSLGEHGCVGYDCNTLYSEQLHVPWVLMSEQTHHPVSRNQGFAATADIGITLSDWLTAQGPRGEGHGISLVPAMLGSSVELPDRAISSNATGERSIRTQAWMMKHGEVAELYVKPDDRWEANNVASRCPEIVELFDQCMQSPDGSLQALPRELLSAWQ